MQKPYLISKSEPRIGSKAWKKANQKNQIAQYGKNQQKPLYIVIKSKQIGANQRMDDTKRQFMNELQQIPELEDEYFFKSETYDLDYPGDGEIQKQKSKGNDPDLQNIETKPKQSIKVQKIKPKIKNKKIPKFLVLVSLMLSFNMVAGLISYLVYHLTPSNQISSSPLLKSGQIIIDRQFQVGKVYYNNYLITTQTNTSIITINYTMVIAVQECLEEETKFVAVLQKRDQKLFDINGTFIKEIIYDQSDIYLRLIKEGKDSVGQPIDPQVNRTEFNQSSINESQYTSANSSYLKQQLILQVFRFGLMKNGKISNFTFPKKMQKTILGLLRSFIKIFSPLLTKNLYVDKQVISKIKRDNPMKRLLQMFNQSDSNSTNNTQQSNSTDYQDSIYSEQEKHDFETDDESITLQQSSSVNYSGPTHNTQDQSSQSNHFSNSGQLQQATLQSNTAFNSVQNPPNQNYSVMNFDVQQQSYQKAEMNLLESFVAQYDYIKQFEGLIVFYEKKNETLTFSVQGMMDYILTGADKGQDAPGSVRLLLEQDGSLTIVSYDKNINILSANVIGFQIGAYGYLQLKLSLYQDPVDTLKKIPKIIAGVGTVLTLAVYKTKVPILEYTKQLPPLTLKFTLQKIEGVVNLFKGDFIGKVIQLTKIILSGDFQDNLIPNIMKTLELVSDVDKAVRAEQQTNSPVSIIIKILSAVSDIRAIVDSKGMELLNPQNQFAQSLTGQIMSYFNVSFAEAFAIFNAVKGNLSLIRTDGANYLQDLLVSFVSTEIAEVSQEIRSLIPSDVWDDYQKQIEKAKAIIQFLIFVRDKGLEYADYMQFALNQHNTNLIGLVKRVVDLYFRNQTNITDAFVSKVTGRFNVVKNELEQFKNMKEIVNVTQMTNRVHQLFSQILFSDFLNGHFNNEWKNLIDILQSNANGVSSQRGDCCWWSWRKFLFIKVKKICKSWNPAMGDQAAEPSYFTAFKQSTQSLFSSIVSQITTSIESMKSILEDQDLTIVQKYYELKPRVQQLKDIVPASRFDDVLSRIQERMNAAKTIRSRIGCGGTGNINAYITNFQILYDFVLGMRDRFEELKTVGTSTLGQFNQTVYNSIMDNTIVLESVTDFFATYKKYEDTSLQFFNKIKQIAQTYDPKQFAKSTKIATDVFKLYGTITDSLNQLCINKDDNKTSIDLLRQSYKQRFDGVSNLSNEFLASELSRLRDFLGNGSTNLYNTYLSTTFCEIKQQFQSDIAVLFPDFQNFTLIFELYIRMEQIQNYTTSTLSKMKDEAKGLSRRFFKLFTADGYKNFIRKTKKLAESFSLLVDNLSLQLSQIREEAKTIYMFGMAPENQITNCLQIFANSSFVLSSYDTFKNLSAMVVESILIVQSLSFDVIAFVVAAKDVLEYLEDSVSNFQSGTQKIMNSFKSLCQSFLDVSALVNQQYLNNINRDFRNIIIVMNDTIFPNITLNLNAILTKFEGYKFHNDYLEELFNNSMVKLLQYGELIQGCKVKLFKKMKQFSDMAISLIQKLEIGSLNSIFELAEVIKTEFSNFFSSFPGLVRELLDFKSIVDKDFRQIFKFGDFFGNIKNKIKQNYEDSMNRIKSKINQTEEYLKQNSKFYNKFKESSVYSNIQSAKSTFIIQFNDLWSPARSQLNKIQDYLNEITGSVSEILKQLNQAKQKMSQIGKNVEQRIKNIKNYYQQMRKKLFNIKSLFFISLKGDLSETVMESLRKITDQVDKIVDVDLASVNELANSTLNGKVRLIAELIQKAKVAYDKLKDYREVFFGKIQNGLDKVDEFIQNKVVSKFQKLKDGILYIKSKTDLADPNQRMILYQKTIASKRAPIFSYTQMIPTAIGTFMISINIEYTIGAKVFVGLRQFRSIDLGVTFQAALLLQINFSYGIAYILQFGFYLRGSILRAEITPALQLNGIIPIQLVKAIADVEQINSENKVSIDFVTDLQIYAVEIEVGFYLKHIWLEIIWIDIELCFDFWFFSFCISFKLPIGFKIVFKRHDWGYKSPGIPIIKKRILQLTIAKWKY